MAIGKTLRFEIFKRDNFRCQYCGRRPPEAVLEVDHIEPLSKGGTDDFANLITSCFDCNRGKGAVRLSDARSGEGIAADLELLQERKRQADAYADFLAERRADEDRWIWEITQVYERAYRGWTLTHRYRNATLRRFLKDLPGLQVYELMEYAVGRFSGEEDRALRYFAGCCWKRIRGERQD